MDDFPVPMRAAKGANFAVAVLFVTNVVNYADRAILNLLVQPLKISLHLSDGQIGIMQGLAFVITYALAGLFMGRILDRRDRRTLLIICVTIWSLSSAACGFSRNGAELFLARMGVGLGESALIPAAVSLIADFFPPDRRGRAYGFFITGGSAGVALSLIGVGLALPHLDDLSIWLAMQHHVQFEAWRIAMTGMIVPGIVSAFLLFCMREPARGQTESEPLETASGGFAEWLAKRRLFIPHHLFSAFVALALYGVHAWLPSVLMREWDFPPKQAGIVVGAIVAVVGITSAIAAGFIADKALRWRGTRGRLLVAIGMTLIGGVGLATIGFAGSVTAVLAGSILSVMGLQASQVTTVLVISDFASPKSRGQVTSIYFVFAGIIGTAGGPALVGYLNDLAGAKGHSLSHALASAGVVAVVVGVLFGARLVASLNRSRSEPVGPALGAMA